MLKCNDVNSVCQHTVFMWYSNDPYRSTARTTGTVKQELSLSLSLVLTVVFLTLEMTMLQV